MTKAEETLSKIIGYTADKVNRDTDVSTINESVVAMRQHAIEFAEQLAADGWLISDNHMWVNVMDHRIPEGKEYTTEQLYDKFNNQKP